MNEKRKLVIAVDFDGTLVEHEYPHIGRNVPGAFEKLKQWMRDGHLLILYTMRSGEYLEKAVAHCQSFGVHFWAVNENPGQKHWTDSRKVYANVYIDDAAYGCPLIYHKCGRRPFVDWTKILINTNYDK